MRTLPLALRYGPYLQQLGAPQLEVRLRLRPSNHVFPEVSDEVARVPIHGSASRRAGQIEVNIEGRATYAGNDRRCRMAVVWKDFDSYQFGYVSDSGFSGTVNAAEINCRKAGVFVARLVFIKEGKVMPANALYSGAPYIYYPLSSFGDVINVLRYEKPLSLYLDTGTNVGAITTGSEPIGEQEP